MKCNHVDKLFIPYNYFIQEYRIFFYFFLLMNYILDYL